MMNIGWLGGPCPGSSSHDGLPSRVEGTRICWPVDGTRAVLIVSLLSRGAGLSFS